MSRRNAHSGAVDGEKTIPRSWSRRPRALARGQALGIAGTLGVGIGAGRADSLDTVGRALEAVARLVAEKIAEFGIPGAAVGVVKFGFV